MIVRNGKKIVDVFRNGKYIQKAYIGDRLVFEKKGSDQPTVPTFVSTYFIDQSISDPMSRMSGTKQFGKDGTPETNVVSWIRANSHRYVGNYDAERGMVLRQLDDNDSTKYADGSDASFDLTGGVNGCSVFMKMPDFWFIGESLDDTNDKYNIHFSAVEPTDGKNWTKWDGNTLIGVYEALCLDLGDNPNEGVYSVSSFTPTAGVSQNNFKAKARNKSNGDDHFMIVTYEAHQVMALLYICWYGNTNGQNTIGAGTWSYPKVCGDTNVDGMNDTVAENSRSINFWGLENWWGDLEEWIDNLITGDDNYNSSTCVILDYHNKEVRKILDCRTGQVEAMKMVLGQRLDLLSKDSVYNINYDTYYCDSSFCGAYKEIVFARSFNGAMLTGGPFYLAGNFYDSTGRSERGSRLQYHGRVVIDNQPRAISTRMKAKSANAFNPVDLQYVYFNEKEVLRTGFDFHICDVTDFSQIKFKLSGKNINYEDIVFNVDAAVDSDGNVTVNDCHDEMQVTMTYKDNLIGVVCLHSISEEEVIEIEIEKLKNS